MATRETIPDGKREDSKTGRAPDFPQLPKSSIDLRHFSALQHTFGNQAVSQMLGAQHVQMKLRLGPSGDVFEQEADRVAQSVVSMSRTGMSEAGSLHADPGGGIQRKCAKCEEEEEETLRRSPVDGADAMTESAPEQESAPSTTETAPESSATQETPAPEEQAPADAATEEKAAATLLVEDDAEQVGPGQMRKSEFLAALRETVCATANEAMESTGQTTENCPWMEHWFTQAANKDAAYLERALRKYAPETIGASTAQEMIPLVAARVRRSVEIWVTTGEITGVPKGVSTDVPGAQAPEAGGQTEGGQAFFKTRPGGARRVSEPQAIRNQLGPGRPLPGGVRSRMESAFGLGFSQVRIHTDAGAASLSDQLNARAFTVGEHVAFSSGEYQPGSLVGDALLAHELAHVVQQGGTPPTSTRTGDESALESEADLAAAQVVLGATPASTRGLSGLRLQRCSVSAGGGISPSAFQFEQVTGGGDPNDRSLPWYAACVNITITYGPTPRFQICQFEVGFPGVHRLGRTSTGSAQSAAAEAFNECVLSLIRSRSASCSAIASCVQRRLGAQIPGARVNTPCLTKMLTPTDWPTRH